jgi:dihydroorotase-like cyclic amidohydrolase
VEDPPLRRLIAALVLPASLGAQPGAQAADRAPGRRAVQTAIANVTVVDVERGRHRSAQTVLVDGSRIVAVGPQVRVPASARVIDGRRRFLVPGFWDMHIHLLDRGGLAALDGGPSGFALVVANGITGVRNMHGTAPLADIVLTQAA